MHLVSHLHKWRTWNSAFPVVCHLSEKKTTSTVGNSVFSDSGQFSRPAFPQSNSWRQIPWFGIWTKCGVSLTGRRRSWGSRGPPSFVIVNVFKLEHLFSAKMITMEGSDWNQAPQSRTYQVRIWLSSWTLSEGLVLVRMQCHDTSCHTTAS